MREKSDLSRLNTCVRALDVPFFYWLLTFWRRELHLLLPPHLFTLQIMTTTTTSDDSSSSSTRNPSTSPRSFNLGGETVHSTPAVSSSLTSTRDRCRRCQQLVYVTERIGPVKDSLYHKLCFKCMKCDRQLDLKTFFTNSIDLSDKEIYCQSHAPRSGKGVFSTENIHIQNVMKAQKLNVVQKADERLKVRFHCSAMNRMR